MTLVARTRTIDEMRSELETLSQQCLTDAIGRTKDERELLHAVTDSIDKARERLMDVKIAMLRYVTVSLYKDDEFELEENG